MATRNFDCKIARQWTVDRGKAKARWTNVQRVILAAPVRLELTTHGLTEHPIHFYKRHNPLFIRDSAFLQKLVPSLVPTF